MNPMDVLDYDHWTEAYHRLLDELEEIDDDKYALRAYMAKEFMKLLSRQDVKLELTEEQYQELLDRCEEILGLELDGDAWV